MNQKRNVPVPGEFYRHFKNRMYQIIAIAVHSETGEKMVVYQALYGDFKVWVRPLSMFMEAVDREKYPDVKQEYRFEKVAAQSLEAAPEHGGEEENPSEGPGEEPVNRYLLDFFDAMDDKNHDKMLEALAGLAKKASQKEVDDICMVLDIRPSGGPIAAQIADIRRHVLMLKKFDGERLR